MSYLVTATEKTKQKANEFETRSMLYLMNFHKESNKMHWYVIDFFNDVTAFDKFVTENWDLQSKGSKNLSATAIGKDLVTLYKNFLSNFDFVNFIIFMEGVLPQLRLNNTITEFKIDNINLEQLENLKSALEEEAKKKTYIENSLVSRESIDSFLERVVFVIETRTKQDYIKSMINLSSHLMPNDDYLSKIFNQIRDIQSAKKNIGTEGELLTSFSDFEKYSKYISMDDIKLLVFSRVLHKNDLGGMPYTFNCVLSSRPDIDAKVLVEKCQGDIYRLIFDRSNSKKYWEIFENFYNLIQENPEKSINDLYSIVDYDKLKQAHHLDILSAKYFLALIKEAFLNENSNCIYW